MAVVQLGMVNENGRERKRKRRERKRKRRVFKRRRRGGKERWSDERKRNKSVFARPLFVLDKWGPVSKWGSIPLTINICLSMRASASSNSSLARVTSRGSYWKLLELHRDTTILTRARSNMNLFLYCRHFHSENKFQLLWQTAWRNLYFFLGKFVKMIHLEKFLESML